MNNATQLAAIATTVLLAISVSPLAGHKPPRTSDSTCLRHWKSRPTLSTSHPRRANRRSEYDHFSTEDAIFAVDHITVDWNEQAVKAAKEYLYQHSRGGLTNELEYNGFTAAGGVPGSRR